MMMMMINDNYDDNDDYNDRWFFFPTTLFIVFFQRQVIRDAIMNGAHTFEAPGAGWVGWRMMNSFVLAAFLEPPTTKITKEGVWFHSIHFLSTFHPRPLSIQVRFCCLNTTSSWTRLLWAFFFQRLCYGRDPGRTSKNVPRQAPVVAPVARLQWKTSLFGVSKKMISQSLDKLKPQTKFH